MEQVNTNIPWKYITVQYTPDYEADTGDGFSSEVKGWLHLRRGGGRGVVRISANLDSAVVDQKYNVHYEKTTFTELLIQASTP